MQGITFEGWYKEEAYATEWDFENDAVTDNITLYAKWNAKEYTVRYDTKGAGTIADKTGVLFDDKNLLPVAPSKTGYDFTGWKSDDVEVTPDTTYSSLVDSDSVMEVTLTAQWKLKDYTVKYNTQGAAAIADKTGVHYTDKNLLPTDPVKAGYTFDGWKLGDVDVIADATYDSLVADDTVMEITLVAQWKTKEYNVDFKFTSDKNPDSVSVPNGVKAEHGSTIDQPELAVPTDWAFGGWYTDEECTQKFDFSTAVTADITLHGKWKYTEPETTRPEEPTVPETPTEPSEPPKPIVPTPPTTTQPTTTAPTTQPPSTGNAVPKTGDESDIALATMLLLMSGFAGAFTLILKKKHNHLSQN